jgi:hypothetical protein
LALAGRYATANGDSVTLAVRPERITLAHPGTNPEERIVGRVDLSSYLGASVEHVVHVGTEMRLVVNGASSGPVAAPRFAAGEAVALCWTLDSERLFDSADRVIHSVTDTTTSAAAGSHDNQTISKVASDAR